MELMERTELTGQMELMERTELTGQTELTATNGTSTVTIVDEFTQNATSQKTVDILWVIDNSGSMQNEQANLASNFDAFINQFADLGVDFKMSITTTDTSSNYRAGRPVTGSLEALTSQKLAENRSKFISDFQSMIQVGTRGSGREKGILASEAFTQKHAAQNFRDDAYYAVIYVSDEEDQSPNDIATHLSAISAWKTNPNLVKAYSIVDTFSNPANSGNGYDLGSERYQEISNTSGGTISDINADFYTSLLNISTEIVTLTKSFALSKTPVNPSAIIVKVDGVINSSWTYDSATKTIKFSEGQEPQNNQVITVTYEAES